jgi:Fe2+ transport system protein FeoA
MLRYLERIGLVPNCRLTVLEHAPFEGPTMVRFHGEQQSRGISPKLARAVLLHEI